MVQPRTKQLISDAVNTSMAENEVSAVRNIVVGKLRADLMGHMYWIFKKETVLPTSRPANCPPSEWAAANFEGNVIWRITEVNAPGDPRLPSRHKRMFDASNSCSAVCQLMCICFCMRSAPLTLPLRGQPRTITKMHMVSGMYWTPKKVLNPLVMGKTRIHTLIEDANVSQGGMHGYRHTWLEATVIDDGGRLERVGIDPTAAQFGHAADILIWAEDDPAWQSYKSEKVCSDFTLGYVATLLDHGLHTMLPGFHAS